MFVIIEKNVEDGAFGVGSVIEIRVVGPFTRVELARDWIEEQNPFENEDDEDAEGRFEIHEVEGAR